MSSSNQIKTLSLYVVIRSSYHDLYEVLIIIFYRYAYELGFNIFSQSDRSMVKMEDLILNFDLYLLVYNIIYKEDVSNADPFAFYKMRTTSLIVKLNGRCRLKD